MKIPDVKNKNTKNTISIFIRILFFFLIAVGGCQEDENVITDAAVTALSCSSASFSSIPISGSVYTGTATLSYEGGNEASFTTGTSIESTGVTGLTAVLQASTLNNGDGTLTYTINGTPSSSGTASFAISFGGQSCTLTLPVDTSSVASSACGSLTGVAQIVCLAEAFKATLSSSQISTMQLSYTFSNIKTWSNLPAAMSARLGIKMGSLNATQLAAAKVLVQAMSGTTANEGWDEVQQLWAADAVTILATYTAELDNTYITYSGTTAMNTRNDYFRIDGPHVWIEFSVQNGVILSGVHFHSVWRDRVTDYGGTKS